MLPFRSEANLTGMPPSNEGPRTHESVGAPSSSIRAQRYWAEPILGFLGRCPQKWSGRLGTGFQQMQRCWRPSKWIEVESFEEKFEGGMMNTENSEELKTQRNPGKARSS
ncbi:hypothetical protein Pyn_01505 [Prunus yedoensis var. nudiflora]|uniref:Uncharacterized protein n=1 Tax=Prunus yedoensis var. nudiflora TaxID=2094558 RepID=A0A314UBA5_PRUYE|nr:hypothetical protein Pyn_01505 [Prunus yedoensis var. nudiflora]